MVVVGGAAWFRGLGTGVRLLPRVARTGQGCQLHPPPEQPVSRGGSFLTTQDLFLII